jgi:hypothetical protein
VGGRNLGFTEALLCPSMPTTDLAANPTPYRQGDKKKICKPYRTLRASIGFRLRCDPRWHLQVPVEGFLSAVRTKLKLAFSAFGSCE